TSDPRLAKMRRGARPSGASHWVESSWEEGPTPAEPKKAGKEGRSPGRASVSVTPGGSGAGRVGRARREGAAVLPVLSCPVLGGREGGGLIAATLRRRAVGRTKRCFRETRAADREGIASNPSEGTGSVQNLEIAYRSACAKSSSLRRNSCGK